MIFDSNKNSRIYDISPLVSKQSAVFPGDTRFSFKKVLHYEKADKIMLSSFETTCHMGAHADAPLHYAKEGVSIDKQELSLYLGPCQVLDVSSLPFGRIEASFLNNVEIRSKRILLKTNSIKDFDVWQDDFVSLSPQFVSVLGDKGVVLIGVDTPSVDPSQDPHLLSHTECFKRGISILENLDLRLVSQGFYNLVALPLKLKDLEASPVRALLIA